MDDAIGGNAFEQAGGTEDWRVVGDGACAYFETGSFAASARFAAAIGELPGIDDHAPDVDVRPDGVTVRLLTRSADGWGMSRRDVDLARRVSATAKGLGLRSEPSKVQSMLVVPGAADTAAIMPFWHAVLGYERRPDTPDEDLVDPRNRNASFWFEEMQEPRGDDGGGAIHVGVWVAAEVAEERVAAALAAGGHLVRSRAPAWWTLADAAGNEADIATIRGRD